MLGRSRASIGLLGRGLGVATTALATITLLASSLVAASNPAVIITESGQQYHFTPSSITIKVGQTVTWSNSTDAPHTVTADSNGPMHSSIINQGGSYQATFNSAGTFGYHCDIHPYMHGTVLVEAASSHPTAAPQHGATPLPPTDEASSGPPAPMPRRSALLVLIGVVTFMTVLMFGSRLRRRNA